MKSKKFSEMWNLIDRNYRESDFGSRELLIGIFWEETMFQNRKQLHGPAVGFGQIEPATIERLNTWANQKKWFNPTLVLISDDASVRVTIEVLNMLASKLSTSRAVLDGYAGTFHRPKNGTKVTQWLACESILQNAGDLENFDSETVTKALNAAEPNHRTAVSSVVDI
jgi:hypothetical protein